MKLFYDNSPTFSLLRNRLTYSPQTDRLMPLLFLIPSHNARAYHSNVTSF